MEPENSFLCSQQPTTHSSVHNSLPLIPLFTTASHSFLCSQQPATHSSVHNSQPLIPLFATASHSFPCSQQPTTHSSVQNSLPLIPILSKMKPVHILHSCFFNSCNVILPTTLWSSKWSLNSMFIHSVICLTTGPTPLQKRFLHIMQSRASSFK
jgi:hypothetical protein